MKILHLSTWKTGGAAKAGIRLSHALRDLGIDSQITHMSSRIPAYLDAAIGKLTHTTNPIFHSYNYFGENISAKITRFKPDLLHLHWIGAGFITPESLAKFNLPIIWTLHDLWPLCGAEHLPGSLRFQTGYLPSNRPVGETGLDLDRLVWKRKLNAFKNLNITFVAPSSYTVKLARSAKAIASHRLEYIPNGIDTKLYKPLKRHRFGKPIIFFAAMNPQLDPNKGYSGFLQAIQLLPQKLQENLEIKIVGGEVSREAQMVKLYQQASLTIVPSRIENLSFVTMESLACGTPVVAYKVGGIPDLIDHKVDGYLAKPYNVKDLAKGIASLINSPELAKEYGQKGRQKIVREFDIKLSAEKYLDLYKKILAK